LKFDETLSKPILCQVVNCIDTVIKFSRCLIGVIV